MKGDSDVSKSPKDGHKVIYVRARDPFPMGRVRTPLARPDLSSLALFHGIQYNLKVRCPMVGWLVGWRTLVRRAKFKSSDTDFVTQILIYIEWKFHRISFTLVQIKGFEPHSMYGTSSYCCGHPNFQYHS